MKTPKWHDIVALVTGTAALVGASLVLPSPAQAESTSLPQGRAQAVLQRNDLDTL